MSIKHTTQAFSLRELSTGDFLTLGLNRIAYIRPVMLEEGGAGWSLHAADGTLLSVQDQFEMAAQLARHNDLAPVTVH